MLRHPAFFPAQEAGDPQGQTLLAQEDVAAVAGAATPDSIVLRKMQDQAALDVQISLAVEAFGEFAIGAEEFEDGGAMCVMMRMFRTT